MNKRKRVAVYLLSAHEYSDWTILGIYSTREKAEQAKAWYERPYKVEWDDDLQKKSTNPIQEIFLDEPDNPESYDWALGYDVKPEPHPPL